jgi:Family of unknown function (DUF6065)
MEPNSDHVQLSRKDQCSMNKVQTNAADQQTTQPSADLRTPDHRIPCSDGTCPRCQALEARIAELEALTAHREKPAPATTAASTLTLPVMDFKALRLVPYGWGERWQLRPSPPRRHWMDELPHAYKCLPLVIANQWGWQVLCPTDVIVTWDGTESLAGLRAQVDAQYTPAIKSQFGSGIITFSPPWLFRTPPGWDLYLKGPSNRWKHNCIPLEGVIETWWLNYTFTLNWKLLEPGTVTFARGESLGQLIPVPHATFDEATALEAPIGLLEPHAAEELLQWQEKRRQLEHQKVRVHQLYRKAQGVNDHVQNVPVPPIRLIEPWTAGSIQKSAKSENDTCKNPH